MSLYQRAIELKKKKRSVNAVLNHLKEEGVKSHRGNILTHRYISFLLLPLKEKVPMLQRQGLTIKQIRSELVAMGHTNKKGEPASFGTVTYYLYREQILKKKEAQRRIRP